MGLGDQKKNYVIFERSPNVENCVKLYEFPDINQVL